MPVALGSCATCSILLDEQDVFLRGFEHDCHSHREGQSGTALLRGALQLCVRKNTKIKAVQLKLLGRARTEWQQKMESGYHEEEDLQTQVLTFFNAMNNRGKYDYGNQCTYSWKSTSPSDTNLVNRLNLQRSLTPHHHSSISAKEIRQLSPEDIQLQSFNTDSLVATATQVNWYKIFYPGTYNYSFELPIDHRQLETTKVQYGSVKWELHATVDRAGIFNPDLHRIKEVSFIRIPDPLSLEMTETIFFSRHCQDQLHYDTIISGKGFPIGSKIPVAFKLTPLAKVKVQGLKVSVIESIEYRSNDRRVARKAPNRTILLLSKMVGEALSPPWEPSDLRTVRGSELIPVLKRAGQHTAAQPSPETQNDLLGNSDSGLESFGVTTEIEADVQIPTCGMMARNEDLRLHPECSWKNVNVRHWVKIVLRISHLGPDDRNGKTSQSFETAMNLPFTLLNCRATQANINLPAYSDDICQCTTHQTICGCPDALNVPTKCSPRSVMGTLPGVDLTSRDLSSPQGAPHSAYNQQSARPSTEIAGANDPNRPIHHLQRVPNLNPATFNNNIAQSPARELVQEIYETGVMSPPPHYDDIVGGANVDGLADYFSRLANYGFDRPVRAV